MKLKKNKLSQILALSQLRLLNYFSKWLTGILVFCLILTDAHGQEGMAFQSFLVDDSGAPVNGNKNLTFRIYDNETDGELVWSESQTVTINSGNFSVILGEGTWNTDAGTSRKTLSSIFSGAERYIEISVDGSSLQPRLRILPSPYTYHAKKSDTATTATTATTAITANKIVGSEGADILALNSSNDMTFNANNYLFRNDDKSLNINVGNGTSDVQFTTEHGFAFLNHVYIKDYLYTDSCNAVKVHVQGGVSSQPFKIESNFSIFQIEMPQRSTVYFTQQALEGGVWREKTSAHFGHDGHLRSNSDRRIKKNIIDYGGVLNRVMKLRVRSYDFIRSESNDSEQLGVIAQEVKPLFPELVTDPPEGVQLNVNSGLGGFAVNYNLFGILGIKAIQELKQQTDTVVNSLQAENQSLKAELAELKSEYKTVESRLAKIEELLEKAD